MNNTSPVYVYRFTRKAKMILAGAVLGAGLVFGACSDGGLNQDSPPAAGIKAQATPSQSWENGNLPYIGGNSAGSDKNMNCNAPACKAGHK